MTTTAIIVEMVVIGYTSFIWITLFSLFLLNLFGINVPDIGSYWKNDNKELIQFLIIPVTALAYLAGWLIDYFSYRFFYSVLAIGIIQKRTYVDNGKWWDVYDRVLLSGNEMLQADLKQDLAVVKFTRAGVINFVFIGITIWLVLPNVAFTITISVVCMGIAYLCHLTSDNKSRHWYSKIANAYEKLRIKKSADPLEIEKPARDNPKIPIEVIEKEQVKKGKRNKLIWTILFALTYYLAICYYILNI
jgi:hypothetical protein